MMFRFKEINYDNLKSTQKQTAQQLGYSDATIERNRDRMNKCSSSNRKKTRKKIVLPTTF